MAEKVNKKRENPSYENKAETLSPISSNRAVVIKAHDGFDVGLQVIATQGQIDEMVKLGFWKRV